MLAWAPEPIQARGQVAHRQASCLIGLARGRERPAQVWALLMGSPQC